MDESTFLDWVQQARQQGYWITEQMFDPTLRGVGVLLCDHHGDAKGALSMTVQVAVWPHDAVVAQLLPQLLAAARQLKPII